MTATTAEKTMREAFIEAYSEMPDPVKNADNPAFKRDGKVLRYADLEAFLDVAKPILVAAGFALTQEPVSDGPLVGVRTRLLYKTGEEMDFGAFTVALSKPDPQGAGAAITYCRRYAVASIFALAQEDDDANRVSVTPAAKTYGASGTAPVSSAPVPATKAVEANFRAMGAACKENGTRSNVEKAWKAMGVSVAHQTRDGFAALTPEQRATLEQIAQEKPAASDEPPEYSDTDIPF